jgi:hypothetical protein
VTREKVKAEVKNKESVELIFLYRLFSVYAAAGRGK